MKINFGNLFKKTILKFNACFCSGSIKHCDHTRHEQVTNVGRVLDVNGNIVEEWHEPYWKCSGCGARTGKINDLVRRNASLRILKVDLCHLCYKFTCRKGCPNKSYRDDWNKRMEGK